MEDFVFPENNEQQLLEMAERLGFRKLVFCYHIDDPHLRARKEELQESAPSLEIDLAVVVESQQQVQKARKITRNVIGVARREFFDDKRVRHIIDFESGRRSDFIHHRNSGLTQVLINKAILRDITLLVDFRQLIAGKPAQHVVLGRMMQNNQFFRKYRPRVRIVSGARHTLEMRAPRDLQNFLLL